MSEENIRAVQEHYAAFGRGDMEALAATLHPEVEFIAADARAEGGSGPPLRGRDTVLAYLESVHAAVSDNEVEIVSLEAADDRVIASIYLHGTWRRSGVSGAIPTVHVFTLRDGLIAENSMYRQEPEAGDEVGG